MNGYFIDKLNVVQDHTDKGRLPLIGKTGFWRVDLQTGTVSEKMSIMDLKLEGSYSSSLQICCDGNVVSVYGNPSRYGRIDNLFGLTTLEACIEVYNRELKKLGLPIFTKCTNYLYLQNSGAKANKTANGALIKHIDITKNLSVGQGNESTFLKALATQSVNKSVPPYLYPNHHTVEWFGKNMQKNGSTYRYLKCYSKLADLIRHHSKINRSTTDFKDHQYYEKLIAFADEYGIVREEHSFKSPFLKKHNLFAYGLFELSEFEDHLNLITDIRKRLEVTKMKHDNIAQELLDAGICNNKLSANSTQLVYKLWLYGEVIDIARTQFYTHRTRLLKLGIDISIKLDINYQPLRLKEAQIIECKDTQIPDWYRMPEKHSHLSLVA